MYVNVISHLGAGGPAYLGLEVAEVVIAAYAGKVSAISIGSTAEETQAGIVGASTGLGRYGPACSSNRIQYAGSVASCLL